MNQSNSKVAIVTGASRGIGASIAERLANDGFSIVVNYTKEAANAEEVVAKITSAGGHARSSQADVGDALAVKRMFDEAEAAFGGIDVLVNNAGIMELANISDMDDAAFDRMVRINVKGTFNGLREAAKRLRSGGRIINLSTSVVGLYLPTYGPYAATKGAIEALTHILSKELRGRQITVNAVAPGPTATELFLKGKPQNVVDNIAKLAPLERLGTPNDIAGAISFLAGNDGQWINGQILRANGGAI